MIALSFPDRETITQLVTRFRGKRSTMNGS